LASLPIKFRVETLVRVARKNPFFFFDFDGTLTEIVSHPRQVRFKTITRFILEELVKQFSVGVLSGRKLSEVKQLIGVKGLYYSGNHGVEIEGPGLRFVEPQSVKSLKDILLISKTISRQLRNYDVLIEQKKYSVSVHYRNLKPKIAKAAFSELNAILEKPLHRGKVRILHGKKVVEIRPPVDWDKGKALKLILKKTRRGGIPVFFGDDMTDEYGFEETNRLRGVSVFVGKRRGNTSARYWIESPSALIGELSRFLFLIG